MTSTPPGRICSRCHEYKPLAAFHSGGKYVWCKECKRDYDANRYAERGEEVRAKDAARRLEWKLLVFNHYGNGTCACCGEANPLFLSLDHVNGGGIAHRAKLMKKGFSLYRHLVREGFPNDVPLQVLCFNCNLGRNVNGGVCPHRDGGND